mmetsp:Transcript_6628/g.17175  ORF Transcript_6628/g.17175 Transcript_6628/m.17175 type:complete len:350 (+) Transcript_6628:1915-2964(+)
MSFSSSSRRLHASLPSEAAVSTRRSAGHTAIRPSSTRCSSCACPSRLYSSASLRQASRGCSPASAHCGGTTRPRWPAASPLPLASDRCRLRGRCACAAPSAARRTSSASRWKAPREKFDEEKAASAACSTDTSMPQRASDASFCRQATMGGCWIFLAKVLATALCSSVAVPSAAAAERDSAASAMVERQRDATCASRAARIANGRRKDAALTASMSGSSPLRYLRVSCTACSLRCRVRASAWLRALRPRSSPVWPGSAASVPPRWAPSAELPAWPSSAAPARLSWASQRMLDTGRLMLSVAPTVASCVALTWPAASCTSADACDCELSSEKSDRLIDMLGACSVSRYWS